VIAERFVKMFHAFSQPVEPFKPASCRRANWWSARPSRSASQTHQYINCEGGPSEETSFEEKYRCALKFWRAWLLPQQRRPRKLAEITVRLQLTFRSSEEGDPRLLPESLYALVALYKVMCDDPRAAKLRRVVIQVTRHHWLLWQPEMSPTEKAIILPLENIVSNITDPLYGLQEELGDEYSLAKPLVDGCHWILPTCLQEVLGNFTRWIGIATDPRLLSWFGSSLTDLHEGFIV
jgi:hypothetical protein